MESLRIADIYIYPIKSSAGIRVESAEVAPRGLSQDRRWMAVHDNGKFITGREFPALTQIRAEPRDEGLYLTAPGMSPLTVSTAAYDERIKVQVFDDECDALSMKSSTHEWFSDYLETSIHLTYMDNACVRPVDPEFSHPGDEVSFADAYPLLLISQASLDDLNTRTSEPMEMLRFRPNVVVDGATPYAEDNWKRLRMGNIDFDGPEGCARCAFTTVDPKTAEKHSALEPLRTLSQYRRRSGGGVYFGQTLIPRSAGTLHTGDTIEILS